MVISDNVFNVGFIFDDFKDDFLLVVKVVICIFKVIKDFLLDVFKYFKF